jgi:hypothetical protein
MGRIGHHFHGCGQEATSMRTSHPRGFRQQVRFLRRQFLQDGDLPFTNVLSADLVRRALTAFKVSWIDRIFSPLVTLWVLSLQSTTGRGFSDRTSRSHHFFSLWSHQDHIIPWFKPSSIRSLDWRAYQALPESMAIRETLIRVTQPGFRTKTLVVVTTLLDPRQTTKEDLATLYRTRWNNELDLRSIKSSMQMHELRCKTPKLVRKEIWTHVLAYNLIHTVMAQAAVIHDLVPRSISFKGAIQTLEAFQPVIHLQSAQGTAHRLLLYQILLRAIATHRVADRPDRFEPRLKKRRRNHYGWPTKPRSEVKRQMAKGVTVI